jgi:hypothetical protein
VPKNLPTPTNGFNSTQLNIVTSIDVTNTLMTHSIEGRAFLMDNSPDSLNKGTPNLCTVCKQGQVLNWLVYAVDGEKRIDGTWPPSVRIVNITFLNDDDTLARFKVCDLKIFGGPDAARGNAPSYYYWAGIIPPDVPTGTHRYRLVLELDTEQKDVKLYFNVSTPSLYVLPIDHKPIDKPEPIS